MARARNIKPAFFLNTELSEVDPLGRLAFIGLWTLADYKGCIECNFKKIKAQVLPYDECNFEELMNSLEQYRFIRYYSVQGKRYIKIDNFEKHQNPHKNEREAGSEIPDIEESYKENNNLENIEINPDKNGTARADSLLLIPSTLIPNSPNLIPSGTAAEKSAAPQKSKVAGSGETWKAYNDAYLNRYGTEPVRNAKTNSLIVQFVKRIGESESPFVAAFFVTHNNSFYVKQMHALDAMVKDAEKIRTEWATNTQMTGTKANQVDKTQTNLDAFAPLLAEAQAKEIEHGINQTH